MLEFEVLLAANLFIYYFVASCTYAKHMQTVMLVELRLTCPHRPVPPSCSIAGWPHRSQVCKSWLSPSLSFRSRAPPGLIRYPPRTYRNRSTLHHNSHTSKATLTSPYLTHTNASAARRTIEGRDEDIISPGRVSSLQPTLLYLLSLPVLRSRLQLFDVRSRRLS